MSELTPPVPEMGRAEAASPMRRIEVRGGGGPQVVTVDGAPTDMSFEMSSAPDVTFPAVWLDGKRVYAVEVWNEDGLVLSVPPQSEDVDRTFAEHERRRSST